MTRCLTVALTLAIAFSVVSGRFGFDQSRYFNFGGGEVFSDGIRWKSDLRHNSFTVTSNTKNYHSPAGIFTRKYARVYKDHRYIPRWAGNRLVIQIPVRPNLYDVSLMWAETVKRMGRGKRLFTVTVNKKRWRNRFGGTYLDVFAYAGGINRPYMYKFRRVGAFDGFITITLTRVCRRGRRRRCYCIRQCRGCRGPRFTAARKPWCYRCPRPLICSSNPFISGAIIKPTA